MVPNGWKKKPLKDLCKMQAGKFVKASQILPKAEENTYPCFGGNGLRGYAKSFTHSGTYSLIGRQGALCGNITLAEGKFHATEHAVVTHPNSDVDVIWLYYVLNDLNLNQYATGQAQPGLSVKNLDNVYTLAPESASEQRKIAKILSTWDKAISTTESLIDNSKQQKKALMQQLLTGAHTQRKRLLDDSGNPFEGEWEEVKLESVVLKTQLGTTERTKENKDLNVVPLIKMGNLTWGGFNFNKLETVPKSIVDKSLALQAGDFLFNTRNTPDLVGKSAVWKGQLTEATFDNNINRISFNPSVNTDFICFYLNHGKGKSIVNSLPAGSTSVAAIYWKDLKNIKVPRPTIEEQRKIVSVLVNADQEIELLEQQLADLQQEKKALMQQLLTGKRRVKVDDKEVA